MRRIQVQGYGNCPLSQLGTTPGTRIAPQILLRRPKIEDMLCRQGKPHPQILAVLKRLVLVTSRGDTMEAELPEEGEQHLLDHYVFRGLLQVGGEKLAPRTFRCRKRAVRAGHRTGNRATANVTQVTLPVRSIKRFKPLTGEGRVEDRQRPGPRRPFVDSVTRVHQRADHPDESLR